MTPAVGKITLVLRWKLRISWLGFLNWKMFLLMLLLISLPHNRETHPLAIEQTEIVSIMEKLKNNNNKL
jgi:hypothetical protein